VTGDLFSSLETSDQAQRWNYQKFNKSLESGELSLKGDLSIAQNYDTKIHIEYSAEENNKNNLVADITYIDQSDDVFVDAQLKQFSLVPFLQMEFSRSSRATKSGYLTGEVRIESYAVDDIVKADLLH
jgi:hypothetical protein